MISASYLPHLAQLLQARGRDVAELDPPPGEHLDLDRAMQLFELAAANANDPARGLELGLAIKVTAHGWYGLAFLASSTVREAFEVARRYLTLRTFPLAIELTVEGDQAVLTFRDELPRGAARRLLIDCVLGASVSAVELLLGCPLPDSPLELMFDDVGPAHHARYRARLPRIRYGQPLNQARFPVTLLDRPLALGDPLARREAVAMLEGERQLAETSSWAVRTRALLADPRHGFPNLDDAAAALGMTGRTLRRHLGQEGVTFQELRDESRHARAVALLASTSATTEEIARELGYADAAAFTRAFQRWTGTAPSAYRRSRPQD